MLQGLLADGVPIHGIGLQMHLGGGFGLPPRTIRQNIERFASLGLLVHVSEMDVQIGSLPGTRAERLEAQRGIYHDVVETCLAVERCHAITFWGFTDKYTWIDDAFGPDNHPLLFDALYAPKPAYFGVRSALAGR